MADTWDYSEWGWWPPDASPEQQIAASHDTPQNIYHAIVPDEWTITACSAGTAAGTATYATAANTTITITFTFDPDSIPPSLFRTVSEQARQDEKGRELLLSMLTPAQREQMERENRFRVTGSEGGEYLINCTSITGNVCQMDGERIVCHLCAYAMGVTVNDIWLSQKLVLEAYEPLFHAEAEVMIP